MRLAWFSPWPPDRSGIAGRSAELVPALAARGCAIDVCVDESRVPVRREDDAAPAAGSWRVLSAHDVWRLRRQQYDLVVYQIGNSRLHEFIWPYLFRWPGLTVLHDARLHHARGRALLQRRRVAAYRAEFAWNHPDVAAGAAELAVAGLDGPQFYLWPMTRAVTAASRLVAAHSRAAVAALTEESPGARIEYVALGEGRAAAPSVDFSRECRAALGLPPDAVLIGVFGGLTAEKRVPQVLQAFADTRSRLPNARIVLAGTADPAPDLDRRLDALGLTSVAHRLSPPDDESFDRALAAVDVSLHLRWPTALETSGPWVRALAAGRATVIVDLPSAGHVPALDPRTWQPHAPARPDGPAPIAVSVDILDEDHSLRRALVRLGTDPALRERLGAAARDWWTGEHSLDRMIADYERVLPLAAAAPLPTDALPAHLRVDPLAHARQIAAGAGVALPDVFEAR